MANGRGDPRKGSFRIGFDLTQMKKGLRKITKETEAAVRPAAQLGAEEFYLEARLLVPQSDAAHYFYGKNSKKTGVRYYFEPGNLRNAIYQAFSKDNSEKGKATYHIAWNHKKAPYGFMVEYGTSKAAAHPFLRRAYDSRKQIALEIARAEMLDRIGKIL